MLIRKLRRDPTGKVGAVVDQQANNHLQIVQVLVASFNIKVLVARDIVLQSALVAGLGSERHGAVFDSARSIQPN